MQLLVVRKTEIESLGTAAVEHQGFAGFHGWETIKTVRLAFSSVARQQLMTIVNDNCTSCLQETEQKFRRKRGRQAVYAVPPFGIWGSSVPCLKAGFDQHLDKIADKLH
ncbi:hypothetical protein PN462_11175 [Spirulina sp. CS-785/01]|uniref:hypothetical protein n=1 Tax=Spirulina sp. CS-785/01 TaxID=3021716 RepID=UPI00232EF916|nr:hypothetical protein [Spirulina sp. CS-785/01]MDB9313662.1 hypothetical protein [Spirulina sp. CS-785/01]